MTGIISEEKYLYLPSSSSTAANTPAATEDKQFVFPASGLSRATSKISETSTDDKEKEKDELQSGQQTPVENYLPTLEYVPSQKVVLSKSKRILLGTVMMSTTFVAVSLMKKLPKNQCWLFPQSATLSSSLLCIPNSAKDLGITELQAQWVSHFLLSASKACRTNVLTDQFSLLIGQWLWSFGIWAIGWFVWEEVALFARYGCFLDLECHFWCCSSESWR